VLNFSKLHDVGDDKLEGTGTVEGMAERNLSQTLGFFVQATHHHHFDSISKFAVTVAVVAIQCSLDHAPCVSGEDAPRWTTKALDAKDFGLGVVVNDDSWKLGQNSLLPVFCSRTITLGLDIFGGKVARILILILNGKHVK